MTVSTSGPRHRADTRLSTPLTELARTANQLGVARRTAAVAATSSVAIGLIGAGPAGAAENHVASIDTSAVADAAKAQLVTAPVVASPADAAWTADTIAVSATKPVVAKPKPKTVAAASSTATNNPIPASVSGNAVLEVAARYVGTPYVSGGATPSGFDCSGLVSYVYGQLGVSLPHSSTSISRLGTRVTAANAQPGDIIWTPGHVAIYAGGNQMIDANTPGGSVQFRTMWQSNPVFIRI